MMNNGNHSNPLRILLISNKCPPDFDGGYELRAFQIAQALRARGHHLDLVTSRFRPHYQGKREDPDWVHRIFTYAGPSQRQGLMRKFDRILQFVRGTRVAEENVPALESFLGRRKYDIAYCFGLVRIGFATTLPVRTRKIPILWHAGDAHLVERFDRWPRKIPGYDLALTAFAGRWWTEEKSIRFDHVAVVSQFLKDRFTESQLPVQNLYVLPRGIDFPMRDDLDRERAEPPTFFMASRLDPQKGIHHAIAAGGLLKQRRPELNWRLVVAGQPMTPNYDRDLIALAHRDGVGNRVEFIGRQTHPEVIARMRSATAFIFASVYGEPFSSTIIESLASGTPLLGSDDGSILEVVEPGRHALIHRKHSPEELSKNMEQILDDSALRTRLATAGLERIRERYTIDRIMEQTEGVLRSVIDVGRR